MSLIACMLSLIFRASFQEFCFPGVLLQFGASSAPHLTFDRRDAVVYHNIAADIAGHGWCAKASHTIRFYEAKMRLDPVWAQFGLKMLADSNSTQIPGWRSGRSHGALLLHSR